MTLSNAFTNASFGSVSNTGSDNKYTGKDSFTNPETK